MAKRKTAMHRDTALGVVINPQSTSTSSNGTNYFTVMLDWAVTQDNMKPKRAPKRKAKKKKKKKKK